MAPLLEGDSKLADGLIDDVLARRLVAKIARTPAERISPRENQAFMLLLSTLILDRRFIQDYAVPTVNFDNRMRTFIDATASGPFGPN